MRVAALDLGTNSFLCLVADIQGSGIHRTLKVIEDHSRLVRLGQGVHENKSFHPEALTRAQSCLEEFRGILNRLSPDLVVATATSAARDASNGKDLLEMGERLNIPIHIIPGKKEAFLSYAGALSALAPDERRRAISLIDVGGGSTEIVIGKEGKILRSHSFDVGAVRMTEVYFKKDPTSTTQLDQLIADTRKLFQSFEVSPQDMAIAVAGTPTTLACVAKGIEFIESEVEGYRLTQEELRQLIYSICRKSIKEREKIPGLPVLRADVIVAGGALLLCAMERLGQKAVYVSTRGLRYGTALHYEELG